MSVWLVLPSARPEEEAEACLSRWRERGYQIAVFREADRGAVACDLLINTLPYPGYPLAVNTLCQIVMMADSEADWLVAAGDDTWPDERDPRSIARECSEHFWLAANERGHSIDYAESTFGVMQPTGDDWADSQGRLIERVAGSPWLGRQWCRRANGGIGPLWPEYFHTFADEELQLVSTRLGVFWARPDITHLHQHWGRPRPGERMGRRDRMPDFLREANSAEHWRKYRALFGARKAAGFPGSEPL